MCYTTLALALNVNRASHCSIRAPLHYLRIGNSYLQPSAQLLQAAALAVHFELRLRYIRNVATGTPPEAEPVGASFRY